MILAAGRGTRLAPITDHTPKPLLKVQGRPLIEHQIDQLAAAGVTNVVINLHHLGSMIEDVLGDGAHLGVTINYSREVELLETGGGMVNALPLLGKEPFWLLNGDIFTDFDFTTLPRRAAADSDLHLVLTPTPEFRAHGDFTYANGHVTGRGESHVYCGIAVVEPELLSGRPVAPFSFLEIMLDALQHKRLGAQVWHGHWTDIGTVDQLRAAQETRPKN